MKRPFDRLIWLREGDLFLSSLPQNSPPDCFLAYDKCATFGRLLLIQVRQHDYLSSKKPPPPKRIAKVLLNASKNELFVFCGFFFNIQVTFFKHAFYVVVGKTVVDNNAIPLFLRSWKSAWTNVFMVFRKFIPQGFGNL